MRSVADFFYSHGLTRVASLVASYSGQFDPNRREETIMKRSEREEFMSWIVFAALLVAFATWAFNYVG